MRALLLNILTDGVSRRSDYIDFMRLGYISYDLGMCFIQMMMLNCRDYLGLSDKALENRDFSSNFPTSQTLSRPSG